MELIALGVMVSDLLGLPSLKQAKVVAGKGGLERLVSSVSVLEYANPGMMEDSFFHNDEYFGSEIVITGFMNNPNDEQLQCATIKRLAEAGEVGMILYYVGLYVPKVSDKMLSIADQMNFVMIVMPENRMDFRYAEAICEIMELVVKDRMTNTSFVSELLEQVSRLPNHQRTVGTMLRMLSARIMASLILTDQSLVVINEATWPQNLKQTLSKYLTQVTVPEAKMTAPETKAASSETKVAFSETKVTDTETKAALSENDVILPEADGIPVKLELGNEYLCYRFRINAGQNRWMELFVIKDGQELTKLVLDQVVEAVQLAVSIWSTTHDEVAVTELVRSILQDEPMKMRRLASIFHIDVASIHSMLIFHQQKDWNSKAAIQLTRKVVELLRTYNSTVVADVYEGEFVVFMDGLDCLSEEKEVMDAVCMLMEQKDYTGSIACCNQLKDTTDVREAFLLHQSYIEDARKIFVTKNIFHLQEIEFAKECRLRIAQGETALHGYLFPTRLIRQQKEDENDLKTVEVFLLDAQSSYQKASELLFLHKNTVKYRVAQSSDRIGYRIGDMPETLSLYYAVAMERLLRTH